MLDPSCKATQKDVKNVIMQSNSVIDEPEWPFDNIAVFTVNKSAGVHVVVVVDLVFAPIAFSTSPENSACHAGIQSSCRTGLFQSVE